MYRMELSGAKSPTFVEYVNGRQLALIVHLCDNNYHARFIFMFLLTTDTLIIN